jgi:hypothetical protein
MSDYWKDNNIKKPQEIVVCAACRVYGVVFCGARHWDKVMGKQLDAMSSEYRETMPRNEEQGFINQFGEFLTREEAMRIVKENGQPFDKDRNGDDKELYSEGLY